MQFNSKNVRKLVIALLEYAADGPNNLRGGYNRSEWDERFGEIDKEHDEYATQLMQRLIDSGYILPYMAGLDHYNFEQYGHDGITLSGVEYLYQLKHRVRFWFGKNWFPFAVGASSMLVGAGTLIVAIVTLIVNT